MLGNEINSINEISLYGNLNLIASGQKTHWAAKKTTVQDLPKKSLKRTMEILFRKIS